MHLKASSAVIVPSTSFTVKACHSWKIENALSFDQVEQMLFHFMKQKQMWKSNYSTVRLFFLFRSSLNFPSVFLCIIDCVIWLVGRFLVHSRSSFLPLYVNLFSYLKSKCSPNYSGILLLVKGICSTEVPHTVADPDLQISRGARSSRPWDKGGGGLQKDFFRPFGPQFGLKIKGDRPPSPGHLP